jgi:transcriptional regulator with XRE-family HTH domain
MTQAEFGALVGVERSNVSRKLAGRSSIDLAELEAFASACGYRVELVRQPKKRAA